MSIILAADALNRRREEVKGTLAPLALSLRADLDRLLEVGPRVPEAKALLSRDGGRCERDGTPLAFDPFLPHEHRCPSCGATYRGERHDRLWIMSYQLWLAERAVHASALFAFTGEERLQRLAEEILAQYSERYLSYPNRDNVLGPTRPFFSTYLESIWLLQLCVAVSLLEYSQPDLAIGTLARDRIVEPSLALISSYDEGASNRQVWNNAAILAASLLLERDVIAERVVAEGNGLRAHLSEALLADGTWYEGENYHLFAHRGLWYGVTLAEQAGLSLPNDLTRRFDEGFATPLATALPDFTVPSRRDSHHAVSLRQWRFAESCELGLARRNDPRLAGALATLYGSGAPPGDTGRWRSTADAAQPEAARALTRADLGWRSLLHARPVLPPLLAIPPRTMLLEAQGIGVLRRDEGRVYVALDYGHSGGGHGHPDRLNLLFMRGNNRILDDVGTGSYVDPTLHWYRSTLAHNAPFFDGRSQQRANGVLQAFDDRGGAGWIAAEVPADAVASGVSVSRSVVVMADYMIDRVLWRSERETRFELPIHVMATVAGVGSWRAAAFEGGEDPEDGFVFVRGAETASADSEGPVRLRLKHPEDIQAWIFSSAPASWWRATAPGVPGGADAEFLLTRMSGREGGVTTIWSWAGAVESARITRDMLLVEMRDGTRHEHSRRDAEWRITFLAGEARSSIDLGGGRAPANPPPRASRTPPPRFVKPVTLMVRRQGGEARASFSLARESYRVSEETWEEAGRPRAETNIIATGDELQIEVVVHKSPVIFRPPDEADPALDNEHPDIHSDGVQLYLLSPGWGTTAAWLLVPELPAPRVRSRVVAGTRTGVPMRATWQPTGDGYAVRAVCPLSAIGSDSSVEFAVDVLVNDMAPTRMRRRGQLVLSGGAGEYVYLQGDRQSPSRFRRFLVARA